MVLPTYNLFLVNVSRKTLGQNGAVLQEDFSDGLLKWERKRDRKIDHEAKFYFTQINW